METTQERPKLELNMERVKAELFHFDQAPKKYSTIRFDEPDYPFLSKMFERMISYFWLPTEISLIKDKQDFLNCTADEQEIFIKNIQRQTLLDSIQSVHISSALSNVTDNPELSSIISTWNFFEVLHSYSYTHILRTLFENPSVILDEIQSIKDFDFDIQNFDSYYNNAHLSYDHLYMALCCSHVLEGIQFMSSFAMSFAFVESKRVMSGNANILKLILRDENIHVAANEYVIRNISDRVSDETKDSAREFYRLVNEHEKKWVQKLFGDKTIISLNAEILSEFIDYMTYIRMRAVGLEPFKVIEYCPISWFKEWSISTDLQVSPQELELTAYNSQVINSNKLNLKEIELD